METVFLFALMGTLLTQLIRFAKHADHPANIVQKHQQIAPVVILCH